MINQNNFDFVLDLKQKNLGISKYLFLKKDYYPKEVKGYPFVCLIDNDVFLIKIFPIEKNKRNDNSINEIKMLYIFTNELIRKNITPNIICFYSAYYIISNNLIKQRFRYIPFIKLNKKFGIEPYSHILITEYIPKQDITMWYKDCLSNNNLPDDNLWRSIIFQIIYTLEVLQCKYKFMHNDFHLGNILIDEINNLNFQFIINDKTFILPEVKIVPKLSDFEFSTFYSDKRCENKIINQKYNNLIDLKTFTTCLLKLKLPIQTANFIQEVNNLTSLVSLFNLLNFEYFNCYNFGQSNDIDLKVNPLIETKIFKFVDYT